MPGQRITVTGRLGVVYGDPAPGQRRPHQQLISLTDDAGRKFPVTVGSGTQLTGSLHTLVGTRVTVIADVAPRAAGAGGTGQPVLAAQEIRPAAGPRASIQATGTYRWATLLCRFPDDAPTTVTSFPPVFFEPLITGPEPSAESFWKENSRNLISFTGSTVHDWVVLPKNRAQYIGQSPEQYLDELAVDCATAHKAATNLDFSQYSGVNVMLSRELDPANQAAWGGISPLTLGGVDKSWPLTWLPEFAFTNQNFVAHEMGHAFQLPHSSGPYGKTYDSKWDVMSDGGVCTNRHPTYGCMGDHTNAYHKDLAGWIPAERRFVATSTAQTILLDRTALPTDAPNTYWMARIPIGTSTTQYYTVEARRFIGYDREAPFEGLVIHKVDTTRTENTAQVVDPDNNQDVNDAGAVWTPGETFTDPANQIAVQVGSATSTGFQITLVSGGALTTPPLPPQPTPPTTPPTTPPGTGSQPRVRVQTRQVAPGRLEVTLTAQSSTAAPNNTLREIRFGVARNAVVDVPNGPSGFPGGQTVPLAANPTSTTFFVNRVAPGAFTVPFEVVDSSGPWRTFVGAGTSAP